MYTPGLVAASDLLVGSVLHNQPLPFHLHFAENYNSA